MISRILSAVECAWRSKVQGKEAVQILSLALPKRLSMICAADVEKVILNFKSS